MRITIDESAFWIMTIVSLCSVRLREFRLPFETFEQSCNMTLPDILRFNPISQVDRVRDQGLVEIIEEPLPSELRASSFNFEDPLVFVSLTKLGGRVWEAISKANWDAYVEVGVEYLDGNVSKTSLICIDAERLERYVKVWQKFQSVLGNAKPIEGTESYSFLESWNPSYWKSLTGASRIAYRVEENEYSEKCSEIPPETASISAELDALDRWFSIPTEFPQIIDLS